MTKEKIIKELEKEMSIVLAGEEINIVKRAIQKTKTKTAEEIKLFLEDNHFISYGTKKGEKKYNKFWKKKYNKRR